MGCLRVCEGAAIVREARNSRPDRHGILQRPALDQWRGHVQVSSSSSQLAGAAVMARPQRICLVRLSALGDVCLAVPLVRTLQHAFPEAKITWVTTAPMLQLLEGLDGVEFVLAEKASHPFAYLAFYRRMRQRRFDVLLGAQASFRAHFLYPLIRAQRKIGFAKSEARDAHWFFVDEHVRGRREHLLDSFLAFADALGATKRILEWRLPIAAADRAYAEKQLGSEQWIAVNPIA